MDLKKLIDKKNEAAQYMIDEITYIIKNFEKRGPGSVGEKQACDHMAKVLKEDCGCETVYTESFKENPGSFFGWIFFTITFALIAIPMHFFFPLLSAILITIGLLILFFQFGMYKKVVDRFFPEMTGHNVTAIKKCKGEVKRRIFFNGHPDACWEWPVNYKFGGVGFDLHIGLAFIGALYYLVVSVIKLIKYGVTTIDTPDTSSGVFIAGIVGFIYVTKKKIFEECGDITEENWKERADKYLEGEMKTYDQYLRGDVYGYKLTKKIIEKVICPHCGEVIKEYETEIDEDGCWGFYGDCIEENGILDYVGDLEFVEEN